MGSSLCKPRTRKKMVTSTSWTTAEADNPFENMFAKKDRQCLRETYQKLNNPKELLGTIFVDLVNESSVDLKKLFGVDRTPKVDMLKMPKLGGHVARTVEFFDQLTTMIGFTENLLGAYQLVRKTGRLHAKVDFLEANQGKVEKNYFATINDYYAERFIPIVSGSEPDPCATSPEAEERRRRLRFAPKYPIPFINDVWQRFFTVVTAQLTDAFELERQRCLKKDNQKTLAPHQQAEEWERQKRLNAEKLSELEKAPVAVERKQEELYADPF